jgi:hypothetical protein
MAARVSADLHPKVLDIDQDPDGADLDVLRAPRLGESLAFGLVRPGRAPAALVQLPLARPRDPLARLRGG